MLVANAPNDPYVLLGFDRWSWLTASADFRRGVVAGLAAAGSGHLAVRFSDGQLFPSVEAAEQLPFVPTSGGPS